MPRGHHAFRRTVCLAAAAALPTDAHDKEARRTMIQDRHLSAIPTSPPENIAADLVAVFMAAWEEAFLTYAPMVANGVAAGDSDLARNPNYRRFLRAGQTIRWIGGSAAALRAARLIAQQVPGGDIVHFERLWSGLLSE